MYTGGTLDVTLDLETGTHMPYIKPGDKPVYVSSFSNHPPTILKNIPLAVNKRLSEISSNEEIFNKAAPLYQRELTINGYSHKLQYQPPNQKKKRTKQTLKS